MSQRVALVTGGAKGIGAAIVRELARQKNRVGIGFRSSELAATELRDELNALGLEAGAYQVDVRSEKSINDCIHRVEKALGSVEILVNNAGIQKSALIGECDPEDWFEAFHVNVFGPYLASRRVLPNMVAQRWGRIINISSPASRLGAPAQTAYCASKAALDGFTRALAREVGRRNVLVNGIAPGFVQTDLTRNVFKTHRDFLKLMTPAKREGRAEEIASVVGFLSSEDCSFMNGQTVFVDGGLTA